MPEAKGSKFYARFNNGPKILGAETLKDWEFENRAAAEAWVRVIASQKYPQATDAVVIQVGKKQFSFNVYGL